LKIQIAQQILVVVSYIEFQQYVSYSLWDTWKTPFMALCKTGFIMDEYGCKSELPGKF
jgi:hypothetical protein